MKINPSNVEEILFSDQEIWKKIPNCRIHYDHWKMVSFFPGMSSQRKSACIDLLNSIGTRELSVLEEHFGEDVIIEGVDLRLTDSRQVDHQGCMELEVLPHFTELAVFRSKYGSAITFWR